MASAGTASIDVQGDFSGFNSEVEQAGKGLVSKASGWGSAIKAAIAPAFAIGAVVGLEQIGASFDSAFDKIRISTGQTGQALDGLQGSFKNVLAQVPASMDTVADAISTVNQRLGLTGKPLEDLTTQFVNLSRITDTDLNANVEAATGLFNQFGVTADQQGTKLDELFRVSQQTGISFGDLASTMAQGGVSFRNAGLNFEQSAGLLGLLAKNGLSAADVLPSLSRSMATAAKDGKSAATVFQDTFTAIRNAPDDTTAAGVALDVFGARAGPKFAALIREGKLSYEDFAKTIAEGGDTINQAAADTDDWREKLDILKNKALVAIEPIASSVFDGFTRVAEWLLDTGLPKLGDAFGTVRDALAPIVSAVVDWSKSSAWPAIVSLAETVGAALQTGFQWVAEVGIPAVITAFDSVKQWFSDNWPAIQAIFADAWDKVQAGFQWLLDHRAVLIAALTAISLVIFGPLVTAVAGFVIAYEKLDGFRKVVDNIVSWVKGTLLPNLQAAWKWIQDNTQKLVLYISERWEAIKAAVTNIIKVLVVAVGIALAPLIFVWQHAHDQIMDIVNVVWGTIQLTIGTAIRIIKDIIDVVIGLLSGDWGMAWDAIKDIPQAAFEYMIGTVQLGIDAVKAIIEGALAILAGLWQMAWDGIQAVLAGAWGAMTSALSAALTAFVQFFIDLPDRLLAALAALPGLLGTLVTTAVTGMATAAEGAVSGLLSFFSGLADRAVGGLSDLAGKIGGVISTAVTDLKDSAESTVHGILSWFTNLPQRFIDSIGDLGSRLGSFFAGGLRAAWNAVANLWNSTIGGTGFDIPDAIPLIGGDSVRVPNLPTLDTGGIIMHPTLAALAMNSKPEAIIPLDSDVGQTMLAKSTGATETRQGHTFVTNVTGVAADPQELARLNGLEMTWMLRTQAA